MIHKVRGNLLEADVQALVNTVNTVGVMGRGVALQFKRAFPENYKAYERACAKGELNPGQLFVFDLGHLQNPRYIINFATKDHWRGKSRLEYIDAGLRDLVEQIRRHKIASIALPPLGCGLGGLNWSEVYPRIEAALGSLESADVFVFEPVGAPEPSEMKTLSDAPKMTPGRAALLGLMKRYLASLLDDSITLLEIHKLMYFMQEAGEPLKLNFSKGRYGPYARNLHNVLERIEGHFITGYGDGSEEPGKAINYLSESIGRAEEVLKDRPQTAQHFARIERLITGFETPYGMELLSSVHWIARHENPAAGQDADRAIEAVHGWNDRKRDMFKAEHIRAGWGRLKAEKWI